MLKLEDFFGLSIDDNVSDIQPLLTTLGIEKIIKDTKVVKSLVKKNGRDAAIVAVAIRQQTLKYIKSLINEDFLGYESSFYAKEVNTSSNHDRRYSSEDRLLSFVLQVASTKSQKVMAEDKNILTTKQLREAAFLESRYDRVWEMLSQESHHIVSAFRKSKK